MSKKLDLDKLVAGNPKADKAGIQKARHQIKRLRKAGVSPKGYDLAPPFSNRPLANRARKEETA